MRTGGRWTRRVAHVCAALVCVAVLAAAATDGGLKPDQQSSGVSRGSGFSPTNAAADLPAPPTVEIYTTPSCPYCKALRAYLAARDIPFVEHNINATLESRAAFFATGAYGVPVTVIDGQRIQGFNPLRIEAALDAARAAAAESSAPP